jgi:transposase
MAPAQKGDSCRNVQWRHLVENFFCSLKAFRRIATRYEKTDACFAGFVNLVASLLASR